MGRRKQFLLLLQVALFALFFLSGCYLKQVRHLSADVALLKVGESTREDVLIFLGEPDGQKEIGNGVQKWLYQDEKKSLFEKTPGVGKYIGSPEYLRVVVTITDDIVTDTKFSANDEDDLDWARDYSWQD